MAVFPKARNFSPASTLSVGTGQILFSEDVAPEGLSEDGWIQRLV